MGIKESLVSQFGHPRGMTGRFIGWLMSLTNRPLAQWTFEKVSPRSNHFILEVGYGPGIAFEMVARRMKDGLLVGVDHSKLMYHSARKRNKAYCKQRTAVIKHGLIDDIQYPPEFFDIVYGTNVHFYWQNPVLEFEKLRERLKPGGKMVMTFQPRSIKGRIKLTAIAREVDAQFRSAGFVDTKIEYRSMNPVDAISITGYKMK